MKITIEHIKHLSEHAKHGIDAIAAGSSVSFFLYVAGAFDKIINPILAGVGLIMTIIWTYHRIKCLRSKHDV